MNDAPRKSPFANIMAALILGIFTLMGIGLCMQGLWIIGVPIALVTGFMLIRTLLGKTRWTGGDAGDSIHVDTPSSRDP